jgi:hypothetical protein
MLQYEDKTLPTRALFTQLSCNPTSAAGRQAVTPRLHLLHHTVCMQDTSSICWPNTTPLIVLVLLELPGEVLQASALMHTLQMRMAAAMAVNVVQTQRCCSPAAGAQHHAAAVRVAAAVMPCYRGKETPVAGAVAAELSSSAAADVTCTHCPGCAAVSQRTACCFAQHVQVPCPSAAQKPATYDGCHQWLQKKV